MLESGAVVDRGRVSTPWLLVVASLLLAVLLLYVLFAGYLPARQRVARLEAELRDVYRREAELQTRLAQQEQRHALREQQLVALTAERDALVKRLEDLERELSAALDRGEISAGLVEAIGKASRRLSPDGAGRVKVDEGVRWEFTAGAYTYTITSELDGDARPYLSVRVDSPLVPQTEGTADDLRVLLNQYFQGRELSGVLLLPSVNGSK